jgi:DNA modification methylase
MRHPHADLIHAWAEGAEIEVKADVWRVEKRPMWHEQNEYRIKPKQPEWYKNIPPHGVLCWVRNHDRFEPVIDIIKGVRDGLYESKLNEWNIATPLTDDEIRQYLRGGE